MKDVSDALHVVPVAGAGLALLAIAPLIAFSAASAGSTAPRRLNEREIRLAVDGHVLADGAHFRQTFARDGSLRIVSLGRRLSGRWWIAGGLLCESIGDEDACYEVADENRTLRLTRPGTDVTITGAIE